MRLKIIFALFIVLAMAAVANAQTKVSGTLQCSKPDPQYTIAVGDQPGHAFVIAQGKCTWTKSSGLEGLQQTGTEQVFTVFYEVKGNSSHDQRFGVGTMANGDKYYSRTLGSAVLKNGIFTTGKGTWSFVGGTGKLKGLTGKGAYKGTFAPDGTSTWETEGEYELPK